MTNEIVWASGSASNLNTIRELVDIVSRKTVVNVDFNDNNQIDFGMTCPVGVQHWSRSFEWSWAFDRAKISSRDLVFEAGGGVAEFQFLLAKHAKRVVNFDLAQDSLDDAEVFSRSLGLQNLLFRHGSLDSIIYDDNIFDKLICISVVEHIHNAEICIDEMWRILKPGGRLILTMDVAQQVVDSGDVLLFDIDRANKLVSRWGLSVPPFPLGILMRSAGNGVAVAVLCICVEKPA